MKTKYQIIIKTLASSLGLEDIVDQEVSVEPLITACGELTCIDFQNGNRTYIRSNVINTIQILTKKVYAEI